MTAKSSIHSVIAASMILALAGCAASLSIPCPDSQRAMVNDTLYFGLSRPSGSVSAEEWKQFIDAEVTPEFKDGLTYWPASGQWKSETGAIIRESSYVLTWVHPESESTEIAVASVIKSYKLRFSQEAVLRVSGHACVSF
ncbi:MAG: DUF3574 domain-containing protein [Methylococcales bacterium]